MSVVGFDLSTDACRVAVLPSDKVIFQEVKNREGLPDTPAAVCFYGKHRIVGRRAMIQDNCFSEVMKIVGKSKSDLKSDPQLSSLVEKDSNGLLKVCVSDLKEKLWFTPTQLLGMVLSDLKATAESFLKMDTVEECCIGIPAYFSESQRTAVRQAAEIAGFNTVSLVPAIVATAWGHGIIRKKVPKLDTNTKTSTTSKQDTTEEHILAVVDIDQDFMQTAVVSLKSQKLDVMSYECSSGASEKSFVDILVERFKNTSVGNDIREDCQRLKEQSKTNEKMMLRGEEISRSEFQDVCQPVLDEMKVSFQKAVATKQINCILVTGSGSNIFGVKKLLEGLLPKQAGASLKNEKQAGAPLKKKKQAGASLKNEKQAGAPLKKKKQAGAGEKHVLSAANLVAKGCAILCAIGTKALETREVHHTYNSMKDCLLKFKVTDEWPLVMDKMTEAQVAEAIDDGRIVLTSQEITDARECERKMAMREKLRLKIPDILKLNEYAKEKELEKLNNANNQLDNDDLDEVNSHVTSVENKIMARKNERDLHSSTSTDLENKVNKYERLLASMEPKYRTIKQTEKDLLKQKCKELRKWLEIKKQILSHLSKKDDSIGFIKAATEHMTYLEQAWVAAQLERYFRGREPEIESLIYSITHHTFHTTIDDFRLKLLEGVPEKCIMGCRLLPYQTEVKRVPYKWFQVKLNGRNNEFTVLHIKHHNVYNMGFNNMKGQAYEMGPGRRHNNEGQPDEMGPGRRHNNEGQPDEIEPGHQNSNSSLPELTNLTIVGAKYVGFCCDYVSMIDPKKLIKDKKVLMKKFEEFKVGIDPFLDAVHVLGYHDCDPAHYEACTLCHAPDAVPRAVMCISIMLNECTRMNALKNAVGDKLFGMLLVELLVQLIWHWSPMSHLLRAWDANKELTKVSDSMSKCIQATHISQVALIMFLVLNVTSARKEAATNDQGPSSRPSPSSGGDDADKKEKEKKQAAPPSPSEPGRDGANKEQSRPQLGPGQNLLQIFSVTRKGTLSDICGILVHDERGGHTIYSYGGENAPGFILSGPDMAISSEAGCTLEVISKAGNEFGATEDSLMHLDDWSFRYDQPRLRTMPYGDGKIHVSYAILTEAVEANLGIKLQLPLNGLTYNVSGTLMVTQQYGNSMLSVGPAEFVPVLGLSDLIRSRPVKLPLSRSVFAMKLGESVKIEGDLFIGEYLLNISEVLKIPSEVDIIENVKTEHDGAFPYCMSMTLLSRNI